MWCPKRGKLADNQLTSSCSVVLEDAQDVHPFVQAAEVEFSTHQFLLHHLGPENVKNQDILGSVVSGFDGDSAVCHWVRKEFEVLNLFRRSLPSTAVHGNRVVLRVSQRRKTSQ